MLGLKKYNIQIFILLITIICISMPIYMIFGGTIYDDTTIEGNLTISANDAGTSNGDLSVAGDSAITGDETVGGDSTVTGTVQGGTVTDGITTITGGNYTGVGNITGTDVDISAGTGDYSSTGKISIDADTDQIQVTIQANATQTNDIFVVEKSDGTDYVHVEEDGGLHILHTADEVNDHAFEIDMDGAGYGGVHAFDIVYKTGDVAAAQDEEAILISIDESASSGGDVTGVDILSTDEGGAEVYGVRIGATINPIVQLSGTFGNMDSALVNATDRLTEFTSTASDITLFVSDGDTVTIGNATTFQEIEFILGTVAQNAGNNPISIKPTFEYSTGAGTWSTTFNPTDATNGFKNSGVIVWLLADAPGWAVGTGGEYLIRITRTRSTVATSPIEDIVQISSDTKYYWDKNGDVNIRNLTASQQVKAEHLYTTDDMYVTDEIQDGNGANPVTVAELNTAYDHSQDNTQAHTDYFLNTGTDIAGAGAGFTWTFDASAGTDCVWTYGDGTVNLTTGALQENSQYVVTDATDCTDIEGTKLSITGGTLNCTETDSVVGAVNGIVKADGGGNISAAVADTDYLVTLAKDLVTTSPITGGTDNILPGADADITIAIPAATNATAGHATAAHITAIEANTAKVTNATHTGDVTGATALSIGADKVTEAMLKAVNAAVDEYVLTYESTTGDFEWEEMAAGAGDVTAGANLTDNAVVRGDGGAKGVQTSTVLISDNGEMTNPSQPSFLAGLSASQLNQAVGVLYTIPFATEVFDQGGDYDNSTYTFTAPVTGNYLFTFSLYLQQIDIDADYYEFILRAPAATPYTYIIDPDMFDADAAYWTASYTVVVRLSASDTAYVTFLQTAGAAQTDITGNSVYQTTFSGTLLN